jgi:hypothetical protein
MGFEKAGQLLYPEEWKILLISSLATQTFKEQWLLYEPPVLIVDKLHILPAKCMFSTILTKKNVISLKSINRVCSRYGTGTYFLLSTN